MSILGGYVVRQVIAGSLLALLILVFLDLGFAVMSELEDLGAAYGWREAIWHAVLTAPRRMYELFPTAVLLGTLLSLGTVAENSELTAMRAAGTPTWRIASWAMLAGLILMLVAVMLGEVVAPESERRAQNLRAFAQGEQIQLGEQGFWARDRDLYLNVRVVMPGLRLSDLRIYRMDATGGLSEAIQVAEARYQDGRWRLQDLQRSRISVAGVDVEKVELEEWDHLLAPELFDVIIIEPQQMSALALYRYVGYLRANELDASAYELALWTRLFMPISSLVMVLIALPFVFGSLRSGGAGQRLFIGILLGAGFHLLNRTLGYLGVVYGVPPWASAGLPMLLFLLLAIWWLRRVR